ncbi:MAG TPA: tetratricopeptide repeat protein [Anaeromyxobacteraceae bacterium]|nr:tetratricopeptide repeat protein [Anaeromyxobacteraceae bacterium]
MTEKSTPEGSAEATFAAGMAAFHRGDAASAHAAFERAHRRDPRDPRYMSWYGLTLVVVARNSNLGVLLCDQALRGAGSDPDLLLNQARVHLALNQRERTVRALQRGLELWPEHAGLQHARDSLGFRRSPVLPFLSRNHPVNTLLGRLRHRLSRRRGSPSACTPMNLGVILPLSSPVTVAEAPEAPKPEISGD